MDNTKLKEIRQFIYELIDGTDEEDLKNKIFNYAFIVLIILNLIAIIIGSTTGIKDTHKNILFYFEFFSIVIFTIEYLLRIWIAPLKYTTEDKLNLDKIKGDRSIEARRMRAKLKKKRNPYKRYIFSFMALIDLLSIIPFYLPFIFGIFGIVNADARFLKVIRVLRLLRVLKIFRHDDSLFIMRKVFLTERRKLFYTIIIVIMMLLIASSLMFYIEKATQPDKFENIPATLWWAIMTLTTVGYGDVVPVTILGKLLSGVIALLGMGLIAVPSGIISSGFTREMQKEENNNNTMDNEQIINEIKNLLNHLEKNLTEKNL